MFTVRHILTALLTLIYAGYSHQIQSIKFEKDSFATFQVDHLHDISNPQFAARKHFWKIEVFLKATANDGVIFEYRARDETSWLSVGVLTKSVFLHVGKKGMSVIEVQLEENLSQSTTDHIILVEVDNCVVVASMDYKALIKLNLSSNYCDISNFNNSFNLNLGNAHNSSAIKSYRSTFQMCLHRVTVNQHMLILPGDAAKSFYLRPCPLSKPTDCAKNYCSDNGICHKIFQCDRFLQVGEVRVRATKNEHRIVQKNTIAINSSVQWIQLKLEKQVYVNAISLTCSDEKRSQKIDFYMQFALGSENYFNYTEEQNTKIYQTNSMYQKHYLAWPVKTSSFRIQFVSLGKTECKISVNAYGCFDYSVNQPSMLGFDHNDSTLVLQSNLSNLKSIVTTYGIVGEKSSRKTLRSGHVSYKNFILDLISFTYQISFQIEFESKNSNVIIWSTQQPCDVVVNKFDLLEDIEALVSRERKKGLQALQADLICSWRRNGSSETLHEKDFVVRIFAFTPFSPTNNFRIFRQVQIYHKNLKEIKADSTHKCALACLNTKESKCKAFDVRQNILGLLSCRLTTDDTFSMEDNLVYGKNFSTYFVRGWPYLGYQCQCVNRMIGARCDNNSYHDNTFHVVVTKHLNNVNLKCEKFNNSQVIQIQFASGGVTTMDGTEYGENLKNDLNSIEVAELIRSLCDGRKICNLSLSSIDSMLPSSGLNYLKVRFTCQLIPDMFIKKRNLAFLTDISSTYVASTVTYNEGSGGSCDNCYPVPRPSSRSNNTHFLDTMLLNLKFKKSTFPVNFRLFTSANYKSETTSRIPTALSIKNQTTEQETRTTAKITSQQLKTRFYQTTTPFIDKNCVENQLCVAKKTSALIESLNIALQDPNVNVNELAKKQVFLIKRFDKNLGPSDLSQNVDIVSKILKLQQVTSLTENKSEIANSTNELSSMILSSVDLLFDNRLKTVWLKIAESNRTAIANDLTVSINQVGFALAETLEEKQLTSYLENTAFQVVNVNKNLSDPVDDLSFPKSFPEDQKLNLDQNNWVKNIGAITVPVNHKSVLKSSYVFAAYKNLDTLLGNLYHNGQGFENRQFSKTINKKFMVNSYVISASVKPVLNKFWKKKKIKIILKHKKISKNNTRCVFWKAKHQINQTSGYWSSEGCRKLKSNETHTVCECNHLTNFAILMDVVGQKTSEMDEFLLTIITWVGCSLSIICLFLSLFCFNVLRGLQSSRNSIHKNLCTNLILGQSLFLLGSGYTKYQILCPLIAGTIHYLFLVVFAWMCIEGLHLYISLVKVFEVDKASRLVCYYVFAYVFPAIIVGVSAAVDYNGYGTDKSCWLDTKSHLIWAFVGPALCVITANLYFFGIALRVMKAHRITTPHYRSRMAKTRTWMKGSAVLLCLLGIPWIFGVFYIDEKTVFMAYIFTACNSLQGVFIFIFHCILNERVRCELSKYMRRGRWVFSTRSYPITSTTRSAYTTSGSISFRSRHSSGESLGNMTSMSSNFKSEKYTKKRTERQLPPMWNKNTTTLSKEAGTNLSFIKPSSTKPPRRNGALPQQLIIANINAREIEIKEREMRKREAKVEKTEKLKNDDVKVEEKKHLYTGDIKAEQKEKIKQITTELNKRNRNKELLSPSLLEAASGCEDLDSETTNINNHNCKTPVYLRKLRIEQFYRDYKLHFEKSSENEHNIIFRNKSLPSKITLGATTPERDLTSSNLSSCSMGVIQSN